MCAFPLQLYTMVSPWHHASCLRHWTHHFAHRGINTNSIVCSHLLPSCHFFSLKLSLCLTSLNYCQFRPSGGQKPRVTHLSIMTDSSCACVLQQSTLSFHLALILSEYHFPHTFPAFYSCFVTVSPKLVTSSMMMI